VPRPHFFRRVLQASFIDGSIAFCLVLSAWLIHCYSAGSIVHAQDGSKPIEQEEQEKDSISEKFRLLDSPPALFENDSKLPDAIFLRDENNRPIFVPKARYADFEKYMRDRTGAMPSDFPSAILEELTIDAKVESTFVSLKLELTMSPTDASSSFIRLPLGFQQMNWTKPAIAIGGKRSFTTSTSEEEGLVWFVEPDGSAKYKLQMEAVLPVVANAIDSMVNFNLPETVSRIGVSIPGDDWSFTWVGLGGEVIERKSVEGTTRAVVRGRGGNGRLLWRSANAGMDPGALEVESMTQLLIGADDRTLQGSTILRVVADSRTIDRSLTVRLPKGLKWTPSTSSNEKAASARVERAPEPESNSGKDASVSPTALDGRFTGERLRVTFPDRTKNGAMEVVFDWSAIIEDGVDPASIELGLLVEEAQRQSGQLRVIVPATRRMSWLPNVDYLFVSQTPSTEVPGATEYDFQFARPSSMTATISIEATDLVRWRPDYMVHFGRNEMRLEGILTFNADPQSLVGLEIRAAGWRLGDFRMETNGQVLPVEVVDAQTTRLSANALKILSSDIGELFTATPTVIAFSAIQAIPAAETTRIGLQLPKIFLPGGQAPKAERGEGVLLIDRGDWQIVSTDIQVVGLARTTEIPNVLRELMGTDNASDPHAYRFQSEGVEPKWIGRIRRLPQIVSTSIETVISIDENQIVTTRTWEVTTQGPLLERVSLRVPLEWIVLDEVAGHEILSDHVRLYSGGRRLESRVLSKEKDGRGTIEAVQATWPERFTLILEHQMNIETALAAGLTTNFQEVSLPSVSLSVKPAALVFSDSAYIQAGRRVVVKARNIGGEDLLILHDDGRVALTPGETGKSLTLGLAKPNLDSGEFANVEKAWLQTMIAGTSRRDRIVMRVETDSPTLSLVFPSNWYRESIECLVDGKKTLIENDSQVNKVLVRLPQLPSKSVSTADELGTPGANVGFRSSSLDLPVRVVEFFRWEESESGWTEPLTVDLPYPIGSAKSFAFTWQVIVPAGSYLWSRSNGLLSEQRWVWRNLGWQSVTSVDQIDLEKEFGASKQLPLPAATNRYTFRSIFKSSNRDSALKAQLHILPRWMLWLPIATIALLLTALWPRLEIAKHPWLLLVVTFVLVLLAMWAPDAAAILIQCAFASLFIVAVMWAFRWALKQKGHRRSVFSGRSFPSATSRTVTRIGSDKSLISSDGSVGSIPAASPSTRSLENVPATAPEVR
jgi:hypothetical protein